VGTSFSIYLVASLVSCSLLAWLTFFPKAGGRRFTRNVGTALPNCIAHSDRLCGLVVRVLGYRSGGPSSIPGTTRFSEKKKKKRKKTVVGLERGPLSLVSTTEELLDRKVAAPV
jgi:hypothetical protein